MREHINLQIVGLAALCNVIAEKLHEGYDLETATRVMECPNLNGDLYILIMTRKI